MPTLRSALVTSTLENSNDERRSVSRNSAAPLCARARGAEHRDTALRTHQLLETPHDPSPMPRSCTTSAPRTSRKRREEARENPRPFASPSRRRSRRVVLLRRPRDAAPAGAAARRSVSAAATHRSAMRRRRVKSGTYSRANASVFIRNGRYAAVEEAVLACRSRPPLRDRTPPPSRGRAPPPRVVPQVPHRRAVAIGEHHRARAERRGGEAGRAEPGAYFHDVRPSDNVLVAREPRASAAAAVPRDVGDALLRAPPGSRARAAGAGSGAARSVPTWSTVRSGRRPRPPRAGNGAPGDCGPRTSAARPRRTRRPPRTSSR